MNARTIYLLYFILTPGCALLTGINISRGNYGWAMAMALCTLINFNVQRFWYHRAEEEKKRKRK